MGTIFRNNCLLTEKDIKELLESIQNVEQATAFVKEVNGFFALVIELSGTVFLAADHERTIPLFYEIKNDNVFVYNHISIEMIKTHGRNRQALKEFNSCLFISGNDTVACNIKGVMAGETVIISDGKVSRQYYYKFDNAKVEYIDKYELFRMIDEKFVEAIKRLIKFLDGRCAVIPLSGGHDSRLVAYYLKRLKYDKIVTYTYGPRGNSEAITSEKVAKFLDIEWHCVEYEPPKLQVLFKDKFDELVNFYSNGVSSVCIQDWYAVDYLHKKGVFPKNSVFVPGHSFDAIAGSVILPKYIQNDVITKQQLMEDILYKHYSEGKRKLSSKTRSYFKTKINDELLRNEPDILSSDRAFNLFQNYNVRERQAKFICCQTKLYEYYDYDWYLPLWDNELIAFWETINISCKYNRKLFFDFTNYQYKDLMITAPVENEKSREKKMVNMNPVVRVRRKIGQLINYVDYHYCLAYFTPYDVISIYLRKRVLNIGFFVNQKIIEIIRRKK
ncbi:asparagine synthase-related protein [Lactonifactor longoviformis]|uniref:asparagine synthase-related protein n=1 Tax=Lactonifactor longoviformis TaxID=341220 RepID=UPI001A9A32EA|nr:asparagine synthase-related protein [Lactonifactor longoviformis]